MEIAYKGQIPRLTKVEVLTVKSIPRVVLLDSSVHLLSQWCHVTYYYDSGVAHIRANIRVDKGKFQDALVDCGGN
jgi:hypothetical protein